MYIKFTCFYFRMIFNTLLEINTQHINILDFRGRESLEHEGAEENLERIHLMGMEWWTKYGEETISFIEK